MTPHPGRRLTSAKSIRKPKYPHYLSLFEVSEYQPNIKLRWPILEQQSDPCIELVCIKIYTILPSQRARLFQAHHPSSTMSSPNRINEIFVYIVKTQLYLLVVYRLSTTLDHVVESRYTTNKYSCVLTIYTHITLILLF